MSSIIEQNNKKRVKEREREIIQKQLAERSKKEKERNEEYDRLNRALGEYFPTLSAIMDWSIIVVPIVMMLVLWVREDIYAGIATYIVTFVILLYCQRGVVHIWGPLAEDFLKYDKKYKKKPKKKAKAKTVTTKKKGRGRPKGSKNKSKK